MASPMSQPLLSDNDLRKVLCDWNALTRSVPYLCIHQIFEEQTRRTPDAPALAYGAQEFSYRELNERANRLAHYLRGIGVGPDVRVGLCVERSPAMVVAMLGIHKAGGAYVPLDPSYPRERIAFMLEDSAAPVLVTQSSIRESLGLNAEHVVRLDRDAPAIMVECSLPVESGVQPEHLAYVLYTSGSTGKPKGVMVRHRNVVNFFAGMDERLGEEKGVWLAVTSLSFDISVLELLWTLCRGFKVVLHADPTGQAAQPIGVDAARALDFSLMFFASGEGADAGALDKYRLLIEAAKFGDQNGFSAIWTPERHFFAFGGLYPNPSVASAALATITQRIGLRAGSVVAPLHNPIRIAEEWALVDNLSNGRVGISFASGWQPVDFVLCPEAFADRKAVLLQHLDTVRRLWRGETIKLPSPLGKEAEIRTLPRPVQKELPVWLTAAGNPETFVEAAKAGANILTHLLGQKVEEVAEKVALYRKSWTEAGHPGQGTVTLMLHTFVGTDEKEVRETVRQPMKDYLRSSVSLIQAAAWTFPTVKQRVEASGKTLAQLIETNGLSEEDMDAVLEYAFERYYGTSGLFGTPSSCLKMIEQLQAIGVDEVACLLDFGVPTAKVLEHLPHLLTLKDLAAKAAKPVASMDLSAAAEIRRHCVTHLQCTPSQAKAFVLDPATREALASLHVLLLGGEALPPELLTDLGHVPGRAIHNMYGPTETTIWSTSARVDHVRGQVPIGRPLANQQVYILDRHLQPVPVGARGELCIGGDGVAAGYHNKPELTAERFPPDPFSAKPGARLYRTGDLARFRDDGVLEFLGRLDHQVKIRGHRIEPGEIETALRQHPTVRDVVVVAFQGDDSESRLAAYLVSSNGTTPAVGELRQFLASRLPEYMIPAAFVTLPALPLTPNGKIDRKALPAPNVELAQQESSFVAPRTPVEERLAVLWADVLGIDRVGVEDNFLHLGGDSLSAIKLIIEVRSAFGVEIPLQRFFETPTVAALAVIIDEASGSRTEGAKPTTIPTRDRSLPTPLSYGQERIWFQEQLHTGIRAYHEAEAVRLRGPLDISLLQKALDVVVSRHDVLRTCIRVIGDRAEQVVSQSAHVAIKVVDLTALPDGRRKAEMDRLLREEPRRAFDLASEPGIRITLAKLDPADDVLILMQHLMASDRWSMNLLYRELGVVYQALRTGQKPQLPAAAIQYGDFAVWQRQEVESGKFDQELAYWKERLHGAPVALELPIARSRPEIFSYQGQFHTFPLGRALTEDVRSFSRQEEFSPFTVLTAAINALLFRYTSQDDIVLGIPMANRDRPELETLYGLLIDFQALRTDLSGDPTFRELLQRVQKGTLDAHAHRSIPFNKVVEAVQPERDLSRAPLFQIMLTWRDRDLQRDFAALEGMKVSHLPAHGGGAQYDLTLNLTDTGEEYCLEVEYCTDLFEADAIQRMVAHFQTLLAGSLANPQEHLSKLPLLTAAELDQVLVKWNATEADYPRDACIHELFEAQVQRTPDRVALVYENQRLTYRELNQQAEQLAARLHTLGVKPGVLVGLYVDRSPEMVVGLLGTLKARGTYLPLDPLFPPARLAMMLEESNPLVILTQEHLRDSVPSHSAQVVCLDGRESSFLKEPVARPRALPTSLAYVLYTSGSTGRPKGVQVSHRAVVNLLTSMARKPGIEANDTLLSVTTLSFDIAALEIFLPLISGARLLLPGRDVAADGSRLAALLTESGATIMQATPARWRMLIQAGWQGSPRLKILCGGEALPRDLAEQLLARSGSLWNLFGPTETTIWSTVWQVRPGAPIVIGRPIANTQTYVLDAHLQPVPVGVPGELFIGGDGVSAGYLHRPDLTAERFLADPFCADDTARLYRTGDLVRYQPSGELEFLGRLDHQAKTRGFRVELGEIEAVLGLHPEVGDRVVVAREDTMGETYLAAYVVPANGAIPQAKSLRAFLKDQLPEYMVPSAFVVVERLPLTPNGKVDRKALPAPEHARLAGTENHAPPRTATEEKLAAIWQKLLRTPRIGVEDNFFYLGGHSLLAMELAIEIRKGFGITIAMVDLFKSPTIAGLAAVLEREIAPAAVELPVPVRNGVASGEEPWAFVYPIQEGGTKPPLFGIHVLKNIFNGLAPYLPPDQPFYALTSRVGFDGRTPPFYPCTCAEELATQYLQLLRTIQPKGPYYLIGFCLGGFVASEVGRRLIEAGEEVRYLALVDTFPYEGPSKRRQPKEAVTIRLSRHLAELSRAGWRTRTRYIWTHLVTTVQYRWWRLTHMPRVGITAIGSRIRRMLHLPPSAYALQRTVELAALGMSKAYSPKAYPGKLTVFCPRDQGRTNPEFWSSMAPEAELFIMPGEHHTMMEEPNVQHVAKRLTASLLRAQSQTQSSTGPSSSDVAMVRRHVNGADYRMPALAKLPAPELDVATNRKIPAGAAKEQPCSCSTPGDDSWALLYPIKEAGSKPPLIAIHGFDTLLHDIAPYLEDDQPFYAIATHAGFDGSAPLFHPCTTVEEIAERYLKVLRAFQPTGPYHLIGFCLGGFVAYEMARRLTLDGEEVAVLVNVDAFPFTTCANDSSASRTARHLSRLGELDWREKIAYVGGRLWRQGNYEVSQLVRAGKVAGSEVACRALRSLHVRIPQRLLWYPIERAGLAVARRYRPQELDGKMTLFYAGDEPNRNVHFWASLISQGVDATKIPGDHMGILSQSNLRQVAQKVNACLLEAHAQRSLVLST